MCVCVSVCVDVLVFAPVRVPSVLVCVISIQHHVLPSVRPRWRERVGGGAHTEEASGAQERLAPVPDDALPHGEQQGARIAAVSRQSGDRDMGNST